MNEQQSQKPQEKEPKPTAGNPTMSRSHRRTAMLTKMGMMVAISVVISFLHFPILPSAPFLEYEPSNIPVLVGTFVFGPLGGLVIAVLSILLHDLLAGPSSGIYGMLMHLIATGTLVLVAGFVYRGHKTRKRAVIALIAGALSVAIIMIPANLVITPLFMGVPLQAVIAMLPTAIVPFNLLSGVITCVATFLLYKLVSPFLHRW